MAPDLDSKITEFRERMGIPVYPMEPEPEAQRETKTPEEQASEEWADRLVICRVPKVYTIVPRSVEVPPPLVGWHRRQWSLSLLGPTGCGKTWLAVKLLVEMYGDGIRGRYADASLAVEQIKSEFDGAERGKTLRELSTVPALLLDDLGAERGTAYQAEQLGLILRARYNAVLPTIVTSNAQRIDDVVESRIASRLASGVFRVGGRDRRVNQ